MQLSTQFRAGKRLGILATVFAVATSSALYIEAGSGPAGASADQVQFFCAFPGSTNNTVTVTNVTSFQGATGTPGADTALGIGGISLQFSSAATDDLRARGVASVSGNFNIGAPRMGASGIPTSVSSTTIPATPGTPMSLLGNTNTIATFDSGTGITITATGLSLSLLGASSGGARIPLPLAVFCSLDTSQTAVLIAIPGRPCTQGETPSPGHTCVVTTPTPTVTPVPTATPTPIPPADLNFQFSGTTYIAASRSNVPVSGVLAGRLNQPTFSGTLSLDPMSTQIVVLGFLPVQIALTFTSTEATTGTTQGGVLVINSHMYIDMPSASFFGIPLAGGTECSTTSPVSLTLSSNPGASFDPTVTQTMQGTYAIPALNSQCGLLGGLIGSAIAGNANTITISLNPVE